MSGPRSTPPELPGYTYESWLGGGGFADVFLYAQRKPSRRVAIKVLRGEHLSAASLQQFDAEADLMAEVSAHPYIVTIFDAGAAADGRPYIAMEHYPGDHFGVRARGGRLPIAGVLQVSVQVASAVETAHRAGILHRDIKPANILTSAFDRPGLTDFGISAVQQDGAVEQASGISLGYTAPEVIQDELNGGTAASDVYSLAATTYSLLTGHSPVSTPGGDNSQPTLLRKAISGLLTPIGRPDVPPSLDHLLRQALSTDPNLRPQTALAWARALQDIEQQLQLPPTQIEITHTPGETALGRLPADDDDEEGTRRSSPKVVVAQPPTPLQQVAAPPPVGAAPTTQPPRAAPISSVPYEGAEHSTVRRGTAAAKNTVGAASQPAATEVQSDTVMRGVPSATMAEAPTSPPSRRKLATLVSIGVLIVALVAIAALSLGGKSKQKADTGDASADAGLPADPGGIVIAPDSPSGVTTEYTADGKLQVSWVPTNAQPGDTYQVNLTLDGEPAPPRAAKASPATLDVPTGKVPCVSVSALRQGGTSAASTQACAAAAP